MAEVSIGQGAKGHYADYPWWGNFVSIHQPLWDMLKDAQSPPELRWHVNASRQGIEIRFIAADGKPRRAQVWTDGTTHLPIEPDSLAYGPDGEDTGL